MEDPFSGKIANAARLRPRRARRLRPGRQPDQGPPGRHAGRPEAAARPEAIALSGRLYWAVNNEGRSSHACSTAIIGALDPKPSFGIIQHRHRAGHLARQPGPGRHPRPRRRQGQPFQRPDEGLSAIDGAHEVIERLEVPRLARSPPAPRRPPRHRLQDPLRAAEAPHTLPSDAYMTVDRRMLPGDDPDRGHRRSPRRHRRPLSLPRDRRARASTCCRPWSTPTTPACGPCRPPTGPSRRRRRDPLRPGHLRRRRSLRPRRPDRDVRRQRRHLAHRHRLRDHLRRRNRGAACWPTSS